MSRLKTKYLKCGFSGREDGGAEAIIYGVAMPRVERFKYLGLIIQKNGDIEEDIIDYIKWDSKNERMHLGVLCGKRILVGLKV